MLAGMLAFSGCSTVQTQAIAPSPSTVVARLKDKTDWANAPARITKPSDFRSWEPVLEEITGAKPVRSGDVVLATAEIINSACGNEGSPFEPAGCYTPTPSRIYLNADLFKQNDAGCRDVSTCPVDIELLSTWAHEQGHRYAQPRGSTALQSWISEMEAHAFGLYAGEHIARNYSHDIGVKLALLPFKSAGVNVTERTPHFSGECQAFTSEAIASEPPGRPQLPDVAVSIPILALMASGFESFGELWYFLHTASDDAISKRMDANLTRLNEGLDNVVRVFNRMGATPADF